MYYRPFIEAIQKNIEKSLRIHRIKYKISLEYNCSAIVIVNDSETYDDNHLYIWIRLIPTPNGTYYVDISNIVLPVNSRRKGVLTTIFTRLNKCEYVERTRIISVCTPEMFNWCVKHKLVEFQPASFQ